jgi:hypothetical protein
LSSDLDWYRGQYEVLDALVEALQMDNGLLEYRLRAVHDALLDQRALTAEGTTAEGCAPGEGGGAGVAEW